jgi:ABC-type multidrug transport system fused ATPase/permease subunit
MRGMDEAIMSALNDPTATVMANVDVTLKDWPLVPPIFLSDTIVQGLGPVFFFCCVMVIFINTLSEILEEKEHRLRQAMESMGLIPSVYWFSRFLSSSFLVLIGSLTTILLGIAFGFAMFRKSDFAVLFLTFFMFGESMIAFAFFLSTFFKRTQAGVYVGIFVFIIGLLFESFVFSTGFIGYVWFRPSSPPIIPKLLNLLPFFNFGKLFLDISTLTAGERDLLTRTVNPGTGLAWKNITMSIPNDLLPIYSDNSLPVVPPPIQSFYWFAIDIALYAVLTWYLDSVIPNEYGYCLGPLFFLTPEYWGLTFRKTKTEREWLEKYRFSITPQPQNLDSDVQIERENALSEDFSPAVKILHLRKDYTDYRGRLIKTAVFDTCLTFRTGELTALLGQNGAGKSSTINMLCGNSPLTEGDARIFGYSLRSQMHHIRSIMGVCPQHDILFDELTAREHIQLYAGLKGVPRKDWNALINTRLDAVKLLEVVDKPIHTYSGGYPDFT